MAYRVVVTEQAERELRAATDWIARRAPQAAVRWFNGFVDKLTQLSDQPHSHGLAHESTKFPYELRQLLYGRRRTYRALFTIRDDAVVVLTIRHAARDDVMPEDVE